MDPTFAQKLGPDNFTIMGGAHYGKGNAGLSSEFNMCEREYNNDIKKSIMRE